MTDNGREQQRATASFGFRKTLVYSLVPLLLLAALLESTFRVVEIWRPPWQPDYGWGFNADSRLFVPSAETPGAMETAPAKLTTFEKQSFLMPKPAGNFRIFAVGGSSINYASGEIATLGVRLTMAFKGKPKVEFINAGGCGYGSHRLTPIVAEVLEYDPDLIWFHEGNNEFEEMEQLRFAYPRTVPLQRVLFKSAFCRFVRDRLMSGRLSELERARNTRLLGLSPQENGSWAMKKYAPEQIGERMAAFENNLRLIAKLCRDHNVPLLLSSVPSNLWEPRLEDEAASARIRQLFDAGSFEEGMQCARDVLKSSARHQASDAENAIIRKVAEENDVPLADVEARVIASEPHYVPGETLFEDWCHLNGRGKMVMLETVKEQILKLVESKEPAR